MTSYTSQQLTTDYGSRSGTPADLVVLHHAATTSLSALIALMQPGGRTVSAHAAIGGAEVVSTVPELGRSYSLGDAAFERRVLSAECVNSTLDTGNPDTDYLLSDETHESIARWVADVCLRHGITPSRSGARSTWTVIGHNEVYTIHGASYGTKCPGGMRLDWIVQRAQELMVDPDGNEEPMNDAYIYAAAEGAKPARYALIGLGVPGGSFVTTAVAEAQAIGFVSGVRPETDGVGAKNGGPVKKVSQAQLDAAVALYATLRARKLAEERTPGGLTPAPAPTDPVAFEGTITLTQKG